MLGHGGFGITYLASDNNLSKDVAISLGLIEVYREPDGGLGYRRGPAASAPVVPQFLSNRADRSASRRPRTRAGDSSGGARDAVG